MQYEPHELDLPFENCLGFWSPGKDMQIIHIWKSSEHNGYSWLAIIQHGQVTTWKRPILNTAIRSFMEKNFREYMWIEDKNPPRENYYAKENLLSKKTKSEFLYLIQGENGGYIKIGISDSIEDRLSQLQTGSPVLLNIVYSCKGAKLEKKLHTHFANKRMHGEWFDVEIEEIKKVIGEYNGE